MLPCCNPKHLAMAVVFLAIASARAADAPPTQPIVNEIQTPRVTFLQPTQDPYNHTNWMTIQVDFAGRTTSRTNMINDVTVTLTLAWPNPKASPPVDLVLTDSVKLIGIGTAKRNTVFFFVPPEALARSITGIPYDASAAPTYYLVQFKIGDSETPLTSSNYSPGFTSLDAAKSFVGSVSGKAAKGLMFSEVDVPAYILAQVMTHIGGDAYPTFYSTNADAGH